MEAKGIAHMNRRDADARTVQSVPWWKKNAVSLCWTGVMTGSVVALRILAAGGGSLSYATT